MKCIYDNLVVKLSNKAIIKFFVNVKKEKTLNLKIIHKLFNHKKVHISLPPLFFSLIERLNTYIVMRHKKSHY